jgi:cytochrome P450
LESAVDSAASLSAVDARSVVTHLSRLRSPRGQSDPFPIYRQLREMGELLPTPWGGYLLTGYDLCDEVLRSRHWRVIDDGWKTRQGSDRWTGFAHQELSQTLQGLNNGHHTRHRRSIGNPFDRATLNRLYDATADAVDRLLGQLADRLADGEVVDFGRTVGDQLPIAVIGSWLDLPPADHPLLLKLTHEHVVCQELLPAPSQLAAADAAAAGLRDYFAALVQERRAAPGDDIISGWLRTWDALEPDQEAADRAVFYLLMFLFVASVETTSTLLPTMVWLFDQHPEQRQWLQDHPYQVPQAVEEVLRYDPPIHVAGRYATEDTELGGLRIPKDRMVHVIIASANHDPSRVPEPDVFDIRRTGSQQLSMHLAFGGGAHYCVGAALARQEAQVLLEGLIKQLPGMRVSRPPVWTSRVAFRRVTELYVTAGR